MNPVCFAKQKGSKAGFLMPRKNPQARRLRSTESDLAHVVIRIGGEKWMSLNDENRSDGSEALPAGIE